MTFRICQIPPSSGHRQRRKRRRRRNVPPRHRNRPPSRKDTHTLQNLPSLQCYDWRIKMVLLNQRRISKARGPMACSPRAMCWPTWVRAMAPTARPSRIIRRSPSWVARQQKGTVAQKRPRRRRPRYVHGTDAAARRPRHPNDDSPGPGFNECTTFGACKGCERG